MAKEVEVPENVTRSWSCWKVRRRITPMAHNPSVLVAVTKLVWSQYQERWQLGERSLPGRYWYRPHPQITHIFAGLSL